MPTCWIIAGPNGAGKTTFALDFLKEVADCDYFINADLIAAGLSPIMPERHTFLASKIFLSEIQTAIRKRFDFAFETTLSGRRHLHVIGKLREADWNVELIYLALSSVDLSKQRVAERVEHGGHGVTTIDIERRFPRSLRHLFGDYGRVVHHIRCFMNDSDEPVFVFEQDSKQLTIHHQAYYDLLKRSSQR
jgi:predicted ABC-type ATPase